MELDLELEEMELLLLKKQKVGMARDAVRVEAYPKPAPPAICPALIVLVHVFCEHPHAS